jgi:two-component system NtrC family sensor kinase
MPEHVLAAERVLVMDPEAGSRSSLLAEAKARGLRVSVADTAGAAAAALARESYSVAVLAWVPQVADILEMARAAKARDRALEILITCADPGLWTILGPEDPSAFTVLQAPSDPRQVLATVERLLAGRRVAIDNRRLLWELQVANEIAESASGSLDLDEILGRTLTRLVESFQGVAGAIRLRNEATGAFEARARIGFGLDDLESFRLEGRGLWPSDMVIATGRPVLVHDVEEEGWHAGASPERLPIRCVTSAAICAGEQLLGTLDLASPVPGRFDAADQRLIQTIGHHLGMAMQNALLYSRVRQAKAEWLHALDAIGDPIALFDAECRLVRGNAALAAQHGWALTALRGHTCAEVGFCGGGCPDCVVGRAARRSDTTRVEVTRGDGQIFAVTTLPIGESPERVSVVQVAKNVTEEIRAARRLLALSEELALRNQELTATVERLHAAQTQLLQSEKLAALGQLVAGVAHELNNPLTSIVGYGQLVQDQLAAFERRTGDAAVIDESAQDARRIVEEGERAARIVRSLLAFARQQTAERAPQRVQDLLERTLSLCSYAQRVSGTRLSLDIAPSLPPVRADATQLQQTLLNLVINAQQAIAPLGGAGLVEVEARDRPEAGSVVIRVSDNGPGIPEGHLPKLFDPFFTTKPIGQGTGLGLSLAYGVVRDHGGYINVSSQPGVRTTFTIELPALSDAAPPAPPLTVLLLSADTAQRQFLAAMLSGWGHTVKGAETGAEALEQFLTSDADVAIVDRSVCDGAVDRWEAAITARAGGPAVVFTSDHGRRRDFERLARSRGRSILTPPYQLDAVRSALRAGVKEPA